MTAGSSRGGSWRNIVIAVFVTSLLWVSVLLVVSSTIHSAYSSPVADGSANAADRARFQQTVDNYNVLVKNMTLRIRTAEQALHQLRARRAHQIPHSKTPTESPNTDSKSESSDSSSESETEEESGDEEEGESDEEREERQKKEAEEQLVLIGYNATTKSFRRFRPDFKCGDRSPVLPDNEVVECDASGEAPCCSTLGWCGKSKPHCECDLCVNYQENMQVAFKNLKLSVEQRECDNIAANLGKFNTPEECAPLALQTIECGRSIMFAKDYPEWGCRCCAAMDTGSTEVHESWNVYQISVDIEPKSSR